MICSVNNQDFVLLLELVDNLCFLFVAHKNIQLFILSLTQKPLNLN